jgi:peroxiredoxin
VLALAAAVLAGIVAFPLVSHGAPGQGAVAPDFALKDIAGRNQRLSEFRGEIVVLSFWTSSCGECRETLQALGGLGATATDAPVVISINIDDDAARAASVARSLGGGFATLLDTRQTVARMYGVPHLPFTVLLDRDGVVRGSWARDPVARDALLAGIRELQGQ